MLEGTRLEYVYTHFPTKNKMLKVRVVLHDSNQNECHHFSFVEETWAQKRPEIWEQVSVRTIDNENYENFPEISKFTKLNLCNYLGQPIHALYEGMERLRVYGDAKDYLRITDEENEELRIAAITRDRDFFAQKLFDLGILDRWKQEADELIEWLQNKTGIIWVNPYTHPNVIRPMTKEQLKWYEGKDFSNEGILRREQERLFKLKSKKLQELKDDFDSRCRTLKEGYEILKFLIENDFSTENVIYHDYTKEVVFNWKQAGEQFSIDEYYRLMSMENKPVWVENWVYNKK